MSSLTFIAGQSVCILLEPVTALSVQMSNGQDKVVMCSNTFRVLVDC
jgi:hypothetical protein